MGRFDDDYDYEEPLAQVMERAIRASRARGHHEPESLIEEARFLAEARRAWAARENQTTEDLTPEDASEGQTPEDTSENDLTDEFMAGIGLRRNP